MPFSQRKPGPTTNLDTRLRTNESVFSAYYPRLQQWAMQITRNKRTEAEDLVHNFYVRLHRTTRSLDEIEEPERYLFKTLRNLYYSQLRRAGHDPLNDLSIVDYDSLEQGLATADRRSLFLIRDDLRRICRYACERKNAVRSASVLILRFFHGYFPSEIMMILQASRSSVDKFLQAARNEARLILQRPDAIRSFPSVEKPRILFSKKGESAQHLFSELQEAIFSTTEGRCFDPALLEQRYADGSERDGLTTQELSHLVSCRTCLEQLNAILNLPSLADRSPEDGIESDGGNGPSTTSGMPQKPLKKGPSARSIERRSREIFEHRPRALQVVIDGDVRTLQEVTAEVTKLNLKLGRAENPSLIEVLSEQGYCLSFLPVLEAHSPDQIEQVECASFSDDRSLVLSLRFGPEGAVVHTVYRDPLMAEAEADELRSPSAAVNVPMAPLPCAPTILPSQQSIRRWIDDLLACLKHCFREFPVPGKRPALAGAAVLALGVALGLCLGLHQKIEPITPAALLQHAEIAENLSDPELKIVYQKLRIKTPKRLITRQIYRDSTRHKKLKAEMLDSQTNEIKTKLASAGVDWNEPLSAARYRDWHDHVPVTEDTVREENNLLTLTTTVSNADVTQESLTVRETDFHPVARSITFRSTDYIEVAELDYGTLGWSPAFEPLFEGTASSSPPATPVPFPPPHLLSPEQLDLAELQARLALNEIHADLSAHFDFLRLQTAVEVKGSVERNAQKQQVISALRTLPHVVPAISSIDDFKSRQLHTTTQRDMQAYSAVVQESPLEQFLLENGEGTQELNSISQRILNPAIAIKREIAAIEDLRSRFGNKQELDRASKNIFQQLLDAHVARLNEAVNSEDAVIREITNISSEPSNAPAAPPLSSAGAMLLAFSEELISGESQSQRAFTEVASDLLRSTQAVRNALRALTESEPQPSPPK